MSPDEQFAKSHLYVAEPYCIIPCPSGDFAIFLSYGANRTFIKTLSPAELPAFLSSSFEEARVSAVSRQTSYHTFPRQRSQEPIFDPLDLSAINIKL